MNNLIADLILTFGGVFFAIALLPSLIGRNKPSMGTSIPTGCILLIFACVYSYIGLLLACLSSTILAIMWFALAVQKGMGK